MLSSVEDCFTNLVTVEELGDPESGTVGELLLNRELTSVAIWGESWELWDLDFEWESKLGVWPNAFAFCNIDDFDAERGLGDVGSCFW